MPKKTTLEVLETILTHLKIGKKAFAYSVGISENDIYNLTNRQNAKILSDEIIDKIVEEYPFFNKEYLKSGEGYYLNEGQIGKNKIEEAILLTARSIEKTSEAQLINAKSFDRLTKTFEMMVEKDIKNK